MITVKVERTKAPFELNGFNIKFDEVKFDSKAEAEGFVDGEIAYDYLDNTVVLGNNYKVLEVIED